jgi:hypothetical protein
VVPRITLLGEAKTITHALLFSASSSFTERGSIANYTWSTAGKGESFNRLIAPCGSTPRVAISFRHAGPQQVALQVTNSLGQTSTTVQRVQVPAGALDTSPTPAFDCENPAAGNQPNQPDCVKSFGWSVVQVNSRGNGECFQLQEKSIGQLHPARDARAARTPLASRRNVYEIHASINGPIAIDGLYFPVPHSMQSDFDDTNSTIQIGTQVPIGVGPYQLGSIGLSTVVGSPDRHTGLVPLKADIGLSGSNKSLGGLPLGDLVDVNLSNARTAEGYYISKIKLHVGLPKPLPPLPVDGYLESDNENGAHITGFQVGPFDAVLLPGFGLTNAFFKYVGGLDQVWEGGANIYLPGQAPTGSALLAEPSPVPIPGINFAPPPPDLGIGFKRGRFDHFGIGVNFVPPLQPVLFPGITLTNVHFAFGENPTRFTGGLGVAFGNLVGIDADAFVAFASPDTPYAFPNDVATGDLQPLAGRWLDSLTIAIGGQAHLDLPIGHVPLLHAWVIYQAPDYVEIGSSFTFDVSFLEVKGEGGGWVEPSQGKFSIGGDLNACLHDFDIKILGIKIPPPCLGEGIVISSRGVGGCATVIVPVPPTIIGPTIPVPVEISAGYLWDGGFQTPSFFTCDLGPYSEANPRAAADPGAADARSAQAGSAWAFRLPGRLPSTEVRLTGRGGAPEVTLSGPGGARYSTENPPRDVRHVIVAQYGDRTVIALNHPTGGIWTVAPNPGSVAVTSVAYAKGLPAPKVKGQVSGRGRLRTLTYTDTPAPGRTITFVERGARTYHLIGVARSRHGKIRFRLDDARAGRRQIIAQVDENGIQTASMVIARYSAPGPERPAPPKRLQVTHAAYALTARWSPVPGAVEYEVLVRSSDGGREMQVVRGRSASFPEMEPGLHGTVLVDGVSAAGTPGTKTRTRFGQAPIASPTRTPPRRGKHHHR